MSRHLIPGKQLEYTVVVGWDNPLSTFFASVFDNERDEDDPKHELLFVGCRDKEIPTVAALQAQVAPYATLDQKTIDRLQQDKAAHAQWQESPLQANMRKLRQKVEADYAK